MDSMKNGVTLQAMIYECIQVKTYNGHNWNKQVLMEIWFFPGQGTEPDLHEEGQPDGLKPKHSGKWCTLAFSSRMGKSQWENKLYCMAVNVMEPGRICIANGTDYTSSMALVLRSSVQKTKKFLKDWD